jgi:UDP-N-acetylmuramoyl-tripeptide--D-alanyl-D-alanine ligase
MMLFMKKIITTILTWESRLILARYKPFIVAVTGSVGKTSTKDAIYVALKDQIKYVRKTEKSMNSEIGLPLTVIGAPNAWHSLSGWIKNLLKGLRLIIFKTTYPDCLILELGADHPGDIRNTAKWLKPNIAVITKVSKTPVHVEFFPSPEKVFEEKASLATSVRKGGSVILYSDDEKVMSIAKMVEKNNVKVFSFGLNENADVRGVNNKIDYDENLRPASFSFDVVSDGNTYPVTIKKVIGDAFMYPILSAIAVVKAKNLDIAASIKALNGYDAPKGRMNILEGINGSTIIDDTYNSSPDAVMSALNTLKNLQCSGKKIVALGDMMELGKHSADEHKNIGREAAKFANMIITVGSRSYATASEAVLSGFPKENVVSFDRSGEAGEYLVSKIGSGDIILVKGSQSIRMERVVALLLKEPQKADRLLVRQEKEWLEKK